MADRDWLGGARAYPVRQALILAVAFLSGWVIMTLELLGGRLLAPYFGYSVYQWGAVIGVVLVALSCGYSLGGRLGDGARPAGALLCALSVCAVLILLVPYLARAVLPWSVAFGPAAALSLQRGF